MVKVTRIPLICQTSDKDGNLIDYKEIFHLLWDLQRETRSLKNKAVRLQWEWNDYSSEYMREHGERPSKEEKMDILQYGNIESYIYDRLKRESSLNTANLSTTLKEVSNKFKEYLPSILKGEKSILQFKSNQPLELHNNTIDLDFVDDNYIFTISLLSKEASKKLGKPCRFSFKGVVKDKSTKDILNRCISGTYKIRGSRLVYDKKKKWCLNLSYGFEPEALKLDESKVLGVDLGVAKPFMASVYGDKHRIFAEGGKNSEVEVFRRRVEARRISLLKQGKMCGDGRIGHGYKTRTAPANALEDKITRFRDTMNHKYSRAIVDYAVKENCGVIQMEKLSGITAGEQPRFLKHWSYYDLQMKIENKAKEHGIKVVYIEPKYTSQRCSKCGFIHKENRPEQERFTCQACGFEENADFNASQNIAIRDIDKIIADTLKKQEKAEKSV